MEHCAVIFAAGREEEWKSKKPKALGEVLFKPMIDWVLSALEGAGIRDACVIGGSDAHALEEHLGERVPVVREPAQAMAFVQEHRNGSVVLVNANMPFFDASTITGALQYHEKGHFVFTDVFSRDGGQESPTGAGCFSAEFLVQTLAEMTKEDFSRDNGLPDTAEKRLSGRSGAGVYYVEKEKVSLRADSKRQLQRLNEIARGEIMEKLIENGVEIPCRDGILIGPDCRIGCDTKILPGTILCGSVTIGEDCVIGPNSYVQNAQIGSRVLLNNTQIRNAQILDDADIGPFVQIRPNSVIGSGVHLGNFVEVKNSSIDAGTKVSHLTYVGDSDVGKSVNFGCGVVTVNYTGKSKHRTTIKDGAFIGCNTNLVAPVTVGENSYTAAGSTITADVPDNSLGIARERQVNKEGWVKQKQPYKKKV